MKSNNSNKSKEIHSRSSNNFFKRTYSPNPINIPKKGIPLEQIASNNKDSSLIEKLICPICLQLIWDLVMCNTCSGLFCKIV